MSNQVNKVILLSSSKAERIGTSDKMSVIINAAAVDIENNFLPLQSLKVFIDGVLVDTTISDASGELSISYQRDYIPDTETILYVEHEASNIKSPKKFLPVWWVRDTPLKKKEELKKIEVVNIEVITIEPPRVTISPISKWVAIDRVRQNGLALGNIEYAHLVDDVAVVTEAVKQNWMALEFASERLKKDIAIFNIAVEQNQDAAVFADEDLYRRYVNMINFKKGESFDYTFLNNKIVGLAVCRQEGNWLWAMSPRLKEDKEIVMLAIEENCDSISYIPRELSNDRDIVLTFLRNGGNISYYKKYIWETLLEDEWFLLSAIKINYHIIILIPDSLKNKKKFVLQVIELLNQYWPVDNIDRLYFVNTNLRNDKDIALAVLKHCKSCFQSLSINMKEDPDVRKASWR